MGTSPQEPSGYGNLPFTRYLLTKWECRYWIESCVPVTLYDIYSRALHWDSENKLDVNWNNDPQVVLKNTSRYGLMWTNILRSKCRPNKY